MLTFHLASQSLGSIKRLFPTTNSCSKSNNDRFLTNLIVCRSSALEQVYLSYSDLQLKAVKGAYS